MEDLWNFSPRSEAYLQRFLGAANENRASESRWVKFFANRDTLPASVSGITMKDHEDMDEEASVLNTTSTLSTSDIEKCKEMLDNLENQFDNIVSLCLKNPDLLIVFTDNLSVILLETFLKHVFKQRCLEKQFLDIVFAKLLPVLISRHNSKWLYEVLSHAFLVHPDRFLTTILPLLLSKSVCEDYLLNFCKILPLDCKNCLMKHLCLTPMSADQFLRHINTIYELYKTVERTSDVNTYIYRSLYNSSDVCCNDKMYGRLLIMFLQTDNLNIEYRKLKILVDNHYSIFKKTCEKMLESKHH